VFSRTWTTTAQTTQFAYSYSSLIRAFKFALLLRYLILSSLFIFVLFTRNLNADRDN